MRKKVEENTLAPAPAQHLVMLHDPEAPTDEEAEDDPDAAGVEPVQAGALDSLLARRQRQQNVAVELPLLLRRGDAGWVEVLDLGRDTDGKLRRVEGADPVDSALA